jgi:hypothetical protein
MKLVPNLGADRVIDLMRPHLKPGNQLGCVTPSFSLFAFAELQAAIAKLDRVLLILPPDDDALDLLGAQGDRTHRNKLQARWLANQCAQWLAGQVDLRRAHGCVPQGAAVMCNAQGTPEQVVLGSFALSTDGLGLTPGNPLSLIQASESAAEAAQLAQWFDQQWNALHHQPDSRNTLLQLLRDIGTHQAPFTIYAAILNHLRADHPFVQALALARQPQANLLALYQGWVDCLTAWQAAQVTGSFTTTSTPAQAAARREALRTCQRLELELARLRALATKEKQMAKQVDLNLALEHLETSLNEDRAQININNDKK